MKQQTIVKGRLPVNWISMPLYERGAATILTILLIGMGLISVSLGAMHVVRSTQERQLAAHAQVNAQAGVWAAVEAVRVNLQSLTKDQLTTLAYPQTWTITGSDSLTQQANITDVDPPISPAVDFKITAVITARDTAAKASSSVEVVYSVEPGIVGGPLTLSGVLDFYNDLTATGGITLNAPGNQGLDFNVDGNFTAKSAGISGTGFRHINVTGNIELNSQVSAQILRGRNITLDQAASATSIEAWGFPKGHELSVGDETDDKKTSTCCGNITVKAWPTRKPGETVDPDIVTTAKANGSVNSTAGRVDTILARRDVTVAGKGAGTVKAVGNVTLNSPENIGDVLAGGNLSIQANNKSTGVKAALGKVTCPGGNPENMHVIKATSAENLDPNCKGTADSTITPPTITPVEQVKLVRPTIDAWALKESANYAIEYAPNGTLSIKVKNVNGIANGDYFLGHYGKEQWHICSSVEPLNHQCTTGEESTATPFCINSNEYTSCFSADKNKKTLDIKADSTPAGLLPGVIWFNGTLNLAGGPFFNTFIATEDIVTYGKFKVYSVNYASRYLPEGNSDAICKNQTAIPKFDGRYPSNFCSESLEFIAHPLGNIGLLAGGYSQSTPSTYVGGKITLGNDTNIYGTVVAGNILEASGASHIYGYVSAAGLKGLETEENKMTAEVKIDLSQKHPNYTPEKIPNTSNNGGVSSPATAVVLWSRYR